jgi:hypothetical protein
VPSFQPLQKTYERQRQDFASPVRTEEKHVISTCSIFTCFQKCNFGKPETKKKILEKKRVKNAFFFSLSQTVTSQQPRNGRHDKQAEAAHGCAHRFGLTGQTKISDEWVLSLNPVSKPASPGKAPSLTWNWSVPPPPPHRHQPENDSGDNPAIEAGHDDGL